jgi:hypothetical protein
MAREHGKLETKTDHTDFKVDKMRTVDKRFGAAFDYCVEHVPRLYEEMRDGRTRGTFAPRQLARSGLGAAAIARTVTSYTSYLLIYSLPS